MDLNADNYQAYINDYLVPWGINLVLALAIFFVGRWLGKIIVSTVERILNKSKLDEVLVSFLGNILQTVILVVVVIAALDQLGVDTKSVLAIFAAAGLAVGLALKDSLSNFAAGVMLVIFKPFKIGDLVETAGVTGVIDIIGIFNTTLHTGDNKEITIPNAQIYGGVITNYSARDTRRIDLVIGIGYDDDIQAAKQKIEQLIAADERILKEPSATLLVSELGESSIDLVVRPWVATADYWSVRSDFLESIKVEFDKAGISIPYPQRDVHVYQKGS